MLLLELTKVHEWESLQTLHQEVPRDQMSLYYGSSPGGLILTRATWLGSLGHWCASSECPVCHCTVVTSVSLAVSVSQGAATALWETRPTSPTTSLARFESNPKGSRGLPCEYLGNIQASRCLWVQLIPGKHLKVLQNLMLVQWPKLSQCALVALAALSSVLLALASLSQGAATTALSVM